MTQSQFQLYISLSFLNCVHKTFSLTQTAALEKPEEHFPLLFLTFRAEITIALLNHGVAHSRLNTDVHFFHAKNTTAQEKLKKSRTIDDEIADLGFGEVCSLVESLAGELQPILLPGDPVGHVGHGCHPTIVSLQTQSTHDVRVAGGGRDGQPWSVIFGCRRESERRKKKNLRKTTHTGLS